MNPTVISTAFVANACRKKPLWVRQTAESDQHGGQRQHLPDFDSDIEADDVCDQAVLRQVQLLKLGRQTESVEQAKDQHSDFRVGLKSQEPPETIHVVESFVDHREPNDRVDDVGVRMNSSEDATPTT